jgi:hypothetical protein
MVNCILSFFLRMFNDIGQMGEDNGAFVPQAAGRQDKMLRRDRKYPNNDQELNPTHPDRYDSSE